MSSHPFFGIYIMRTPYLVLRDPEIIRLILTKEFSHFRDRHAYIRNQKDFLGHNLFHIEGEKWRALRVRLTPTFTSGKLKGMYPHFVNCAEALNQLLLSRLESIVDIKDITSSFTNDTICCCAFGLEVNSLSNKDDEFKKIGVDLFTPKVEFKAKHALALTFPTIHKYFTPRFFPKYMEDFLLKVVKESVEFREKSGMKRNDFIDLLIQLRKEGVVGNDLKDDMGNGIKPVEITYEMMAAQCFVFFAAGFETSGSVQSYCLFELALNPDIQDRLYNEIAKNIKKHGELNYQGIQEMSYLDMVVHETMRKYPTIAILTRRCTKPFTMPSGHRVDIGDMIAIPVYSLHHDPSYFPDPEVFDPERFSPENKERIKPYTYLPFGEGPRVCIGMRFGLLQTKVGLITILRKYRVEKSVSTEVPLKLIGSGVVTTVAGPIKLKLTKREDPV